jgi:hypothetical protein
LTPAVTTTGAASRSLGQCLADEGQQGQNWEHDRPLCVSELGCPTPFLTRPRRAPGATRIFVAVSGDLGGPEMADVAYLLVIVGGFVLLGLMLAGLERL